MIIKTKKYNVPENFISLVNNMEKYYYEVESRKALLSYALNKDMTESSSFTAYENEYKSFFKQLEVAKEQVHREVILPALSEEEKQNKYEWFINFENNIVEIDLWGE